MGQTITKFVPPPFLLGNTVEEIHQRMMASLPPDIDRGEGGFPWDYTRPTAQEKAEYVGYNLTNTIRGIFAQWCEDYLLDYHADMRGMTRRPAEHATAVLTISGDEDTVVPEGFIVSTAATYQRPSISFSVDREVTLGAGPAEVPITAVEPGTAGNVGAHTIIIVDAPLEGLRTIDNAAPAKGGIDQESSEALRDRIVEYDRNQGVSFVGSTADYRRWAMEVKGVGDVQVIGGENGDCTVKLVVTDATGNPADEVLRKAVYDHIMRPDDPSQRLAGVNDLLTVESPTTVVIAITAHLTLDGTTTIQQVKEELRLRLGEYYLGPEGAQKGVIRYTEIGYRILDCAGVLDYDPGTFKVNGATANIQVSRGQIPVTRESDITLEVVG